MKRVIKDTIFIIAIWFANLVSPGVASNMMEGWVKVIKRNREIKDKENL